MALAKEVWKTIEDMESLPEGTRAELIDGIIIYNTAPTIAHQRIVSFLTRKIGNYIESNHGKCEVFPSPFDVQLSADDKYNLFQPDVTVVCDPSKLNSGKRCIGAPDWVIEVVSPSTKAQDYMIKLNKYQRAGVREYWIVDPEKKRIMQHYFEKGIWNERYFNQSVEVGIYPNFEIDFSLLEM